MNIQQSLNQLLTTATIGAGIYTQTPEFKIQQLKEQNKKLGEVSFAQAAKAREMDKKRTEEQKAQGIDYETEYLEGPYLDYLKADIRNKSQIFRLDPTVANQEALQNAIDAHKDMITANEESQPVLDEIAKSYQQKLAEEKAYLSQFASYQNRKSQEGALNDRKAHLKSKGGNN